MEKFLKRSEEIEDYVTFMGPQTQLEDVKKEIVSVQQLIRPYQNRQEHHSKREIYYETVWTRINEFSKEIEQIGQRKKWITEETIQGANKIIYQKKEEI